MPPQTARKPARPEGGLLGKEFAHSGWVTNDMDKAIEIFSRRYGIREHRFIEGPLPTGGNIRVAFAWAGGQILELICASGPGSEFYNEMLPGDAFAIRFHHLGFIVHDQEGWDALEAELAAEEWPIAHKTLSGTFIDAYYVKARELGHYLEYIRPMSAGIEFYASVPAN